MTRTEARIIDANGNRVCEGLRVIEDICRFQLEEKEWQQTLKNMRHKLRSFLQEQAEDMINSRNSLSDVGFNSSGIMENKRHNNKQIIKANCKRVQEGLRVMEELHKISDPALSKEIKTYRYLIYDMEKKILQLVARKKLLRGLYLILTDPPQGYEELTRMAVKENLPAVQLRYKKDNSRHFLALAKKIRQLTKGCRTLFIVNDRVDIAMMSQADGVHIGQTDLPPQEVRKIVGKKMIIGLSTHNLEQVKQANQEPVDYIGFGPLYKTSSKQVPDPVIGPEMLVKAAEISKHPIVAIGGLNKERISRINKNLFHNIAVITAVSQTEEPQKIMREINNICCKEMQA